VANYFVGQSIGVDEKNTFQYIFNFLSSIKQDQYISVNNIFLSSMKKLRHRLWRFN